MALLIERTQNINWEEDSHDVRGDLEEAANLSKLVLVGTIVSDRLFNKPAFWEIVLKSWRFVSMSIATQSSPKHFSRAELHFVKVLTKAPMKWSGEFQGTADAPPLLLRFPGKKMHANSTFYAGGFLLKISLHKEEIQHEDERDPRP
ncbi:hypothetical protein CJ030_MR7G000803 [Morella rubra]|uniref:Uncharacterized protein n=1 Tax=Morella rubra TaxID=262757 RepID=A0A6A1V5D2_9ROSI|nr:hypothetical protein CJ030_MR7G000803 [Morella rubra]